MNDPRYAHDCSECIFLGHFAEADLYVCEKGIGGSTVIARIGNEGEMYISGLALAPLVPELAEAASRARARGLLP
jgi:hypothetical protein